MPTFSAPQKNKVWQVWLAVLGRKKLNFHWHFTGLQPFATKLVSAFCEIQAYSSDQ